MPETKKKNSVPYVPFKTFLAAIEGLEHGIPHQIDASFWPSYSGTIKSQLLGSFRFLGLIEDGGRPSASLKSLVEDKANRQAILRKLLETSYPKIVGVGLQQMTPQQFDELMREYGMHGATHDKATSFFLKAAKYAEMPMSTWLGQKTRASGSRKKRSEFGAKGHDSIRDAILPPAQVQGTSKTIELKSGGKLTLILSANVFDLNSDDREFVFGMIDKLQEYGRKNETASQ